MRIRKHKKIPANQRIQLTSKEKSELLVEGNVTINHLLLLNVAILGLSRIAVQENSQLESIIFSFKEVLYQTFFIDSVYSFSKIATFILLIIDVLVLYWRLIRRYHQMQLRHIIRELHYIADNNFDHRIPFKLNGDLGKVVNSVNRLVDSTVQALEEERRIEKSKDELITNISHDIRTPYAAIPFAVCKLLL